MLHDSIMIQDDIIGPLFQKHRFDRAGWVPLSTPLTMDRYDLWLSENRYGTMEFLKSHRNNKANPLAVLPEAKSSFVFSVDYLPAPVPLNSTQLNYLPKSLQVAAYARGQDYHVWLKDRLIFLIEDLVKLFPRDIFLPFVDSGPVLERDLANRAGLGWVGKNTCLINEKYGSFSFIAEIYTSLEVNREATTNILPAPDRCGTCTRCIDACPTQALVAPKLLDANLCISYLTIEHRKTIAPDLAAKMGNLYFGCDICQSICPWNQKNFEPSALPATSAGTLVAPNNEDRQTCINEIKVILNASKKELESFFLGTPLSRARPWMHKRNAVIAAVNLKLVELRPDIEKLSGDQRLDETVHWALANLTD